MLKYTDKNGNEVIVDLLDMALSLFEEDDESDTKDTGPYEPNVKTGTKDSTIKKIPKDDNKEAKIYSLSELLLEFLEDDTSEEEILLYKIKKEKEELDSYLEKYEEILKNKKHIKDAINEKLSILEELKQKL